MRASRCVAYGVVSVLGAGCPGTIDDPEAFDRASFSPTVLRDAEVAYVPERGEEPETETGAMDAATRDTGAADAWPASDSAATWRTDAQSAEASAPQASDAALATIDAGSAVVDAGGCDFRALIASKCGNAACHGALAVSTGLDLTSDNLAARLSGKKGTLACASYPLVDTERPERSAIYLKVTADACGTRMPLGGTLTDDEQMCILQWLSNL